MRFVWAMVLAAACAIGAQAAAVVTGGAVEGVGEDGLTVYKGIPFAAPPLGELRWRAPQPVHPWNGVRKADRFAPACMQTGVSMPGEAPPQTSEDCLYLNIWAPSGAKKLPVIVWIYGGGFTNGSAAMPLYRGDGLARKGAIVVTFGYRVGPLGFLALEELTRESPEHTSGNYGLMDEIAALKWVQKNIAAFGGDPQRVTIAGQSAGAACVSILMASPAAKGLFQRAIGESGGMFEPMALAPGYFLNNAEKDGQAYAAALGAPSLAALRALPARDLFKANVDAVSHPVIEPAVLPQSPYDVFAAGKQNDVPVLAGANEEEARALVKDLDAVTAATYDAEIVKHWGPLPAPLYDQYPHATDAQARQARLNFERDLRFAWDDWTWVKLESSTGHNAAYGYRFAHKPPFPPDSPYAGWGASHFAELWYVFAHLDQEPWAWTADDRRLSDAMARYWVNFAANGDPNGPGLPAWPRFTKDDGRVLMLDDPITAAPTPHLDALQVFDQVYAQARGAH
ncbi:MAG TPA: carboxylesterase family protein [Rhizomicrobium sp.]|nr:carboxylesterase family protein [Rhizomicrobium sp.]